MLTCPGLRRPIPDVLGRDPAHVEGVGLLALLADAVRILRLDPELVPESMFTE
jgi:hypothetical protein